MSSSYMTTEEEVLDYGDKIDKLKNQIKGLTTHQKDLKVKIRDLMLNELKLKKLVGEKVKIEIRTKKAFNIDIFEKTYPELYGKYTRIESRIVTITEKEFIFDKDKFMKLHKEAYEDCFKHGTPGVYITRLNT